MIVPELADPGAVAARRSAPPIAAEEPEPAAEVLARLTTAGYRHRFELAGGRLRCPDCGAAAHPADFAVEAALPVTDHDAGGAMLFALECLYCGVKGTWHVTTIGPAEQAAIARLRDGRPRSSSPGRRY